MNEEQPYYYAEGSPIPLELDVGHLAVDLDRLETEGPDRELVDYLRQTARRLKRQLCMVERRELPEEIAGQLEGSGALQPVFRQGETLLVVLPEVRVEASALEQQEEVREFLDQADIRSEIVRDCGDRLVLRPATGRGLDALHLANLLFEQVHPDMAQVRFVRVVPRPAARTAGRE